MHLFMVFLGLFVLVGLGISSGAVGIQLMDEENRLCILFLAVSFLCGFFTFRLAYSNREVIANFGKKNVEITTEITIEETENATELKTVSDENLIKIAIIDNYPGSEIIIYDNKSGTFIYENEKYNFSVENNIIFIEKDNKSIKYIYFK